MTSEKFTKTLLISLLMLSIKAYSQETETIIFKGNDSKKTSKRRKDDFKNVIKLSPTGIFVGQMPLIYERKLNENISVQAGFGLTEQNYIRSLFVGSGDGGRNINVNTTDILGDGYSDESEPLYKFAARKAITGTMFTIQPKFYYGDDALNGRYFGVSYSNINYKFEVPSQDKKSTKAEDEKVSDFMLHFGTQSVNKHFAFEVSSAIGLRKVTGTKYVFSNSSSGNKEGFASYSQTTFNYEVAIRVGYVF